MYFVLGLFLIYLVIHFWKLMLVVGAVWLAHRYWEAIREAWDWLLDAIDPWLLPYRRRRALRQISFITAETVDEMLRVSMQQQRLDAVIDLPSTAITREPDER